jgi:hypothetical protein
MVNTLAIGTIGGSKFHIIPLLEGGLLKAETIPFTIRLD